MRIWVLWRLKGSPHALFAVNARFELVWHATPQIVELAVSVKDALPSHGIHVRAIEEDLGLLNIRRKVKVFRR
jgi:hypothetical protein